MYYIYLTNYTIDVYAHNVLVTQEGNATLCDFGASFFYSRSSPRTFEQIEVQAYGLLVHDLAVRVDESLTNKEMEVEKEKEEKEREMEKAKSMKERLQKISACCLLPVASERPTFSDICNLLLQLK